MKLDHIALKSHDIKKSIEWYLKHLDGKTLYEDDSWGMIKVHNTVIAFVLPDNHQPHIAFSVNDVDDIPCVKSAIKEHRDGSLYHYKTDPFGNVIEWIHWPV